MKIAIVLLLIIIGACLAMYTLNEPFYDRGSDFEIHNYASNECPFSYSPHSQTLSCINQPCASPYES